jgi:hypothetical protein
MEVNVMSLAFNTEPKYKVTMLTREEGTRGPGTPPVVKGLAWFTDGSKMKEESLWAFCGKKAQYLCRKVCYTFSG